MNITCYECGQAGDIQTNCPHLMKVRTAAIRADGTEEEEETDDNTVSYRANAIRIALDTEKQVMAKIMAM